MKLFLLASLLLTTALTPVVANYSVTDQHVTRQHPERTPTSPTDLSATAASPTQVNLTWKAATDVGGRVAGYYVYAGTKLVGTTTGTKFDVTNLTPATTYSFTVVAFNSERQDSPKSAAVSVTTPSQSTGTGTGTGSGVQAVPDNTFLGSLGVNLHMSQGYAESEYAPMMIYTGIRNVRDGETSMANYTALNQATKSATTPGVKFDELTACDIAPATQLAVQMANAGLLLSIEGANEPNNFPIMYNGAEGGDSTTWLPVAQCQASLYTTVKQNATLNPYPVFDVSETGAETNNVGLQFIAIPTTVTNTLMPAGTVFANYGNAHNYVTSTNNSLYENNQAWQAASPTLNGPWDGMYNDYGVTWWSGNGCPCTGYPVAQLPSIPRVTTETGWDSSSNPGGTTVQGKVLTNTYLAQFKEGWAYTFIYEMVDAEGSTGDQGLYTSSHSAKPSATYIHNLTSILADDTNFSAGQLNYSITEPSTVHDLLLQKSSAATSNPNAFELVVWDENVSGTDTVTVNLGGSHGTVNVYDITTGTTATSTLHNVSSVSLTLSDHAEIVEVID